MKNNINTAKTTEYKKHSFSKMGSTTKVYITLLSVLLIIFLSSTAAYAWFSASSVSFATPLYAADLAVNLSIRDSAGRAFELGQEGSGITEIDLSSTTATAEPGSAYESVNISSACKWLSRLDDESGYILTRYLVMENSGNVDVATYIKFAYDFADSIEEESYNIIKDYCYFSVSDVSSAVLYYNSLEEYCAETTINAASLDKNSKSIRYLTDEIRLGNVLCKEGQTLSYIRMCIYFDEGTPSRYLSAFERLTIDTTFMATQKSYYVPEEQTNYWYCGTTDEFENALLMAPSSDTIVLTETLNFEKDIVIDKPLNFDLNGFSFYTTGNFKYEFDASESVTIKLPQLSKLYVYGDFEIDTPNSSCSIQGRSSDGAQIFLGWYEEGLKGGSFVANCILDTSSDTNGLYLSDIIINQMTDSGTYKLGSISIVSSTNVFVGAGTQIDGIIASSATRDVQILNYGQIGYVDLRNQTQNKSSSLRYQLYIENGNMIGYTYTTAADIVLYLPSWAMADTENQNGNTKIIYTEGYQLSYEYADDGREHRILGSNNFTWEDVIYPTDSIYIEDVYHGTDMEYDEELFNVYHDDDGNLWRFIIKDYTNKTALLTEFIPADGISSAMTIPSVVYVDTTGNGDAYTVVQLGTNLFNINNISVINSILIPQSVQSIGYNAFNSTQITSIDFVGGSSDYFTIYGSLKYGNFSFLSKDKTRLIQVLGINRRNNQRLVSYAIPTTVTSIEKDALKALGRVVDYYILTPTAPIISLMSTFGEVYTVRNENGYITYASNGITIYVLESVYEQYKEDAVYNEFLTRIVGGVNCIEEIKRTTEGNVWIYDATSGEQLEFAGEVYNVYFYNTLQTTDGAPTNAYFGQVAVEIQFYYNGELYYNTSTEMRGQGVEMASTASYTCSDLTGDSTERKLYYISVPAVATNISIYFTNYSTLDNTNRAITSTMTETSLHEGMFFYGKVSDYTTTQGYNNSTMYVYTLHYYDDFSTDDAGIHLEGTSAQADQITLRGSMRVYERTVSSSTQSGYTTGSGTTPSSYGYNESKDIFYARSYSNDYEEYIMEDLEFITVYFQNDYYYQNGQSSSYICAHLYAFTDIETGTSSTRTRISNCYGGLTSDSTNDTNALFSAPGVLMSYVGTVNNSYTDGENAPIYSCLVPKGWAIKIIFNAGANCAANEKQITYAENNKIYYLSNNNLLSYDVSLTEIKAALVYFEDADEWATSKIYCQAQGTFGGETKFLNDVGAMMTIQVATTADDHPIYAFLVGQGMLIRFGRGPFYGHGFNFSNNTSTKKPVTQEYSYFITETTPASAGTVYSIDKTSSTRSVYYENEDGDTTTTETSGYYMQETYTYAFAGVYIYSESTIYSNSFVWFFNVTVSESGELLATVVTIYTDSLTVQIPDKLTDADGKEYTVVNSGTPTTSVVIYEFKYY